MAGDEDPKTLKRENRELLRTRQALSQEIEDLLHKKAALSDEIDALLTARSGSELAEAIETLADYNRRFFIRVLEREIHRCSREIGARFSTLHLSTDRPPPPWFGEFLGKTVRLSDVATKVSPTTWWIYLSGAGGLGRRLFLARFARNLQVAQAHHELDLTIFIGGATYPVDGDEADHLIEGAARRKRELHVHGDLSLLNLEAPQRPPSKRVELMPPEGVVDTGDPQADPNRVLDAIQAAVAGGQAGELVVRSANTVGRVYIYAGKVAWAHCTARDVSLAEYLVGVGGVDPEEIKLAYDHCRQTGDNFAETLIEFGTFERDEMRSVLCQHLRAHLEAVLTLPEPELLFLPQNRVYNSDLLFPLSTLISHRPRSRDDIIHALRFKQVEETEVSKA